MDEQVKNQASPEMPAAQETQKEVAQPETKSATPQALSAETVDDEKLSQQIEDILKNSSSEKEKILKFKALGYEQEEMIKLFGLKKSTVYTYLPVHPKGKGDKDEKPEAEASTRFPLVLKDGKGEVLSPEAVYHQLVISDGLDGERDFKALMKWAVTIEMVQRMTQIRKGEAEAVAASIKPMLDMMEKSRQELDAAAARARESTLEVAEAAAAGAAARATMHIDERFNELKQQKADIATVHDPMKGLMARTMETMMNRLTGMALPGGQVPPTPGMLDKRVQQQGG